MAQADSINNIIHLVTSSPAKARPWKQLDRQATGFLIMGNSLIGLCGIADIVMTATESLVAKVRTEDTVELAQLRFAIEHLCSSIYDIGEQYEKELKFSEEN
jgi:hypothetical protein